MAAARTTRRARTRARTASLALAAATLLAACGAATPPQRGGAGAIAKAGELSLLKLREGDCVGDLRERIDNPDGGHNGVPRVRAVPCGEPHDGEVLQIAPIDTAEDWPGEAIVAGEAARGRPALQQRLDRVARRTDAPAGQLTLLTFKPIQERWEFEDQHEIVYLVLYKRPQRGSLDG
ncbi:MAG TPA: hypothetical protein VGO80_23740 [Solirubrobacteraceae bacterium]|jgi:hypothetical protein|nr:hypothetical protein [Solirubrobacteraceae bacterium]